MRRCQLLLDLTHNWKRYSMQIFKCEWHPRSYPRSWPSGATAERRRVAALLWSGGGAGLASLDWLLQLSEILRAVNTRPECQQWGREITDRQLRYRTQWQFLWNKATGEDHTALIQDCSKKGWGKFKLRKTVGMSVVRWWANCTIPPAAVSPAPTFQHQPLQQPNNNNSSSAQQQSPQHLVQLWAVA